MILVSIYINFYAKIVRFGIWIWDMRFWDFNNNLIVFWDFEILNFEFDKRSTVFYD
jgi:hypothetical protein